MTPISHYLSARSLRWIFAACAIAACSNTNSTSVQTSAPDSLITEKPTGGFTILRERDPLPPLPKAGDTFTDPTFGTTILRLTDGADGNQEMGVQYSYWPAFNSDSTRIHVNGKYGPSRSVFFTFDPATLTAGSPFKLEIPPPEGFLLERSDMIWSGIDPDLIYGHNGHVDASGGAPRQLWAYDLVLRQYTKIKDFSSVLLPDGSSLLLPDGNLAQMSKSLDDQVFAFTLTDATGLPAGYFAWDRGRDQILVREVVPLLDEVQVDKSGRYLIVVYDGGNDDIFDLAASPPTLIAKLTRAEGFGFVHRDTGMGTIVTAFPTDALGFRRLATPRDVKSLIQGHWSYHTQQDHVSMLADNERWVLSSRFSTSGGPVLNPFDNEIVQVATDGSDRVRRIAHHRSVVSIFEDQPKASISRDGRHVAFTSNWGTIGGRRDVYLVVNIPPAPTS
ncbi:MAG: hypothetical protein HOP32_08195 [Nitrospira sp.]|nr:hypothetical protein [Nitrospira sp.]